MSKATDALTALKTLLAAGTYTNTPAGVWIYPDDYASIDTALFPFIVISESVGQVNSMQAITTTAFTRRWLVEILVFIAAGPLEFPNADSASAELLTQEWVDELHTVLASDVTLGGNCLSIGDGARGAPLFFQDQATHSQWNQEVYWTLRLLAPVIQEY